MTDFNKFTELPAPDSGAPGAAARRQDRMPPIIGAPEGIHGVLDDLSVGFVGVGSVGAPAAIHLARMQVGALYLIDPKPFKEESVLTQPIGPESVGEWKATSVGAFCKRISPDTRVFCFNGSIEDIDISELTVIDVFLMATDNLAAEIATGQTTRRLGRGLIHGAVQGETTVAQIRTFANRESGDPCPGCGFSQGEWNRLHQQVKFSCEPGPSSGSNGRTVLAPATFSIPNLCSLAGDLMVMNLLKFALPFGAPVADTHHEYCGHTGRTFTTPLVRKPDCRCDHDPWKFQTSLHPVSESSLEEIARDAGGAIDPDDPPVFRVEGFDWVEAVECLSGHRREVNRFVPADEPPAGGGCFTCGDAAFCPPLSRREAVSAPSLGSALKTPLWELGVDDTNWIQIRTTSNTTLIQNPIDKP